jgi:alginate O-acetyltransferase complex protein AlgI
VYIPLGGNRVSKWRHALNIILVWSLTGFWHGAEWNFIIWGLYFGIILLIEKFFLLGLFSKLPKYAESIICRIYTLFLVVIGFVIFNETSLSGVSATLTAMFGGADIALVNDESIYYLSSYAIIITVAAVLSTPIAKKAAAAISNFKLGEIVLSSLKPVCYIVILLVCTASLINGSFNPFIYFRF